MLDGFTQFVQNPDANCLCLEPSPDLFSCYFWDREQAAISIVFITIMQLNSYVDQEMHTLIIFSLDICYWKFSFFFFAISGTPSKWTDINLFLSDNQIEKK